MKTKWTKYAFLLLLFFAPLSVWANYSPKGAVLTLWKRGVFIQGPCGLCAESIAFWEPEDRWDFSDFPNFYQHGHYYLDFSGKAGDTVTMFGERSFKPDRGFLIVVKKDAAQVFIREIDSFTPDTWVEVPAQEGTSGAFAAFYRPYENFRFNLSSVKWGNWWGGQPPPAKAN